MRPHDSIRWNAYPALAAAAAFSCGILIGRMLLPPLWLTAAMFAAAVLLSIGFRTRRIVSMQRLHLTACVMAAITAAGAVRYVSYYSVPVHHVTRVAGEDELHLVGAIADAPRWLPWGGRFTLNVDSVGGREATGLLSVLVESDEGRPRLRACDRVQIRGRLETLPHPRNPGDFDYGRFLAQRRIFAVLKAQEVTAPGSRQRSAGCAAAELRESLRNHIHRVVREEEARAVVEALVLGDRSVVDREVIDRFVRTGLLHLLAVSGLHVMVVGMILYRLLGPMLMRFGLRWRAVEITRSAVTAVILLIYMMVTGASPSVVRAVVMTILFTGATVFQRTAHPMNSLGAAALVILALSPDQLFEPGFQLSFAAVAGILGITLPLPEGGVAGRLYSGIAVTVSATAATLPVVVYHFGRISLGGLLLNVMAVPLTSGVLCSAIVALAAAQLSTGIADLFGASAEFLAQILLRIAEEGDRWLGWSYIKWPVEDAAVPIALGLAVAAVGCRRYARTRWRLISLALLICCGSIWSRLIDGSYERRLDMLFLDVGQGDAILLLTPNRSAVLIDSGVRTPFSDSGKRVLVPLLDHLRVSSLHTVIITHPDADHLGGMPALMRAVPIRRLLTNGLRHTSQLYGEVEGLTDSLSIPSRTLTAGDTVAVEGAVRISVLYPVTPKTGIDPNESSIVLHVRHGETSFLLTGDAPVHAEEEVVDRYGFLLDGDVLKVGHHGSETSSSPGLISFLRARGTSLAVLSVAERNRYGLPDSSVVRRIRAAGITAYSTSKAGAIWLRSDGKTLEKVEWRLDQ